jgi:hypothetical protein
MRPNMNLINLKNRERKALSIKKRVYSGLLKLMDRLKRRLSDLSNSSKMCPKGSKHQKPSIKTLVRN